MGSYGLDQSRSGWRRASGSQWLGSSSGVRARSGKLQSLGFSRRLSRSRWQPISMMAVRMISKNTSAVDLNVDGLGDALGVRPELEDLLVVAVCSWSAACLLMGVAQVGCKQFVLVQHVSVGLIQSDFHTD
jgi:hypothetical protein